MKYVHFRLRSFEHVYTCLLLSFTFMPVRSNFDRVMLADQATFRAIIIRHGLQVIADHANL